MKMGWIIVIIFLLLIIGYPIMVGYIVNTGYVHRVMSDCPECTLENMEKKRAKLKAEHDIKVKENRNIDNGPRKDEKVEVEIPTSYTFNVEFHSGALIQGFISFDVLNHQRNHMELYGTKGTMIVPDPNMFGGPVTISK